MEVNIKCEDGTKILSADDEINKHLSEGWQIFESGVVTFSSSLSSNPIKVAFRMKEKENSKIYNMTWKDITPRHALPMVFSDIQPFELQIERIRTTTDKAENEKLLNEGWILFKKERIHTECNFFNYILVKSLLE
ncbi:MAG: hypothetical protein LLF75_13370 [Eubacteriales bacterium]|nr:hypothetical protein [Eubacteriales bacterium]